MDYFKILSWHLHGGTRKPTGSLSLSRNLNLGLPEYETGVLGYDIQLKICHSYQVNLKITVLLNSCKMFTVLGPYIIHSKYTFF